ncbi:minor capsid protein [Heliobacterium chlorum]|nr:minor capsid protein [Heliobacterium chlorum]
MRELIAVLQQSVPFTYFANTFPVKANDCAAVRLTGGRESSIKANVRRPTIQILIRVEDPALADAKANELFRTFNGKRDFDVGNTHVIFCAAQQSSPLFLGLDESNRSIYSINFSLITEEA